jgi:hypothetical protein
MTDQQILELFSPLNASFLNTDRQSKSPPLLAHYTSIKVMERILQSNEIWFSNPLFMNDLQEVRFGLNEGTRLFSNAELLKKLSAHPSAAAEAEAMFAARVRQVTKTAPVSTVIHRARRSPNGPQLDRPAASRSPPAAQQRSHLMATAVIFLFCVL